jgi:hypothetical protein
MKIFAAAMAGCAFLFAAVSRFSSMRKKKTVEPVSEPG